MELKGVTPPPLTLLVKPSSNHQVKHLMSPLPICGTFLDINGVKPLRVLKKAGLRHETDADWHSADAVQALYMASHRFMPQTLNTDSEAASDADDSDEQPACEDSDSTC